MHISVMPEESLNFWIGGENGGSILSGVYVDATFGEGGHSRLFLERTSQTENVFLVAIDRDARRVNQGKKFFAKEIKSGQLKLVQGNFSELPEILSSLKINHLPVRGILFDFGLCTTQFSEKRGFSFNEKNAPLDMRMSEEDELTAADILNHWEEEALSRIFWEQGEELAARRVAREILHQRETGFRFETVNDLITLLQPILDRGPKRKIHFATRIFQALRMTVNKERESLLQGLENALDVLAPGGRIVTIAFHSGEDRPVKNFFRRESRDCICPPEMPICRCDHRKRLKILTKKPLTPQEEEVKKNPNSRSAKMRAAEKI